MNPEPYNLGLSLFVTLVGVVLIVHAYRKDRQ